MLLVYKFQHACSIYKAVKFVLYDNVDAVVRDVYTVQGVGMILSELRSF